MNVFLNHYRFKYINKGKTKKSDADMNMYVGKYKERYNNRYRNKFKNIFNYKYTHKYKWIYIYN